MAKKKVNKVDPTIEFFEALKIMEKEKGIPAEYIAEKISNAIVVAARRDYDGSDVVHCNIDVDAKTIEVSVNDGRT